MANDRSFLLEVGSLTGKQKEDVRSFPLGVRCDDKCLLVPSGSWIIDGKAKRRCPIVFTISRI